MTCSLTRTPETPWYGLDPVETIPFQAAARRRHGDHLSVQRTPDLLQYDLDGLSGPGLAEPVPVRIRFYRKPPYPTFGLPPRDFPQVHASPGQPSPHRWPDDALCLYAPFDPIEQRWVWTDGLAMLLDITREHLTLEHLWRNPTRRTRRVWLGAEAGHGSPR